ncbi:MAG: hypothetical protein M0R39_17555 [Prolixibacteraceae bacterium]|nr:hypothetical protein [Prolixibacteraceae bacterium]
MFEAEEPKRIPPVDQQKRVLNAEISRSYRFSVADRTSELIATNKAIEDEGTLEIDVRRLYAAVQLCELLHDNYQALIDMRLKNEQKIEDLEQDKQ